MAQANIKAVITAEDRASSTLKGFGDNVGGLGSKVASVAKGAAVALGAATAAAVTFGLKSASELQQARIAFETMLGSADQARTMMKKLSDFAVKTPFALPEVVAGAKGLLAYGISAEKILPTFKALGNIAAGVGKDKLPQLTLAFGQVKAATKLTGMELRQFTEAGVPLLEMLAKQSGKSVAQIKDDMENGAAPSFEEVEKAIFSMSEKGGKFFNLLETQSKTLGGTMSNLKDVAIRTLSEIVGVSVTGDIRKGSLFDVLQTSAQRLLDFLSNHQEEILGFFKKMGDSINDIGKWANANLIPALTFIFDRAKEVASGFIIVWGAVKQYLLPALQVLWDMIRMYIIPIFQELWQKHSKELREAFVVLGVLLGGMVVSSFITFIAVVVTTASIIGGLVAVISTVIGWLKSFGDWMNDLGRRFGDMLRILAIPVRMFLDPAINALRDLIALLQAAIDKIAQLTNAQSKIKSVAGVAAGAAVSSRNRSGGMVHARAGMQLTRVGEEGAENLMLPVGSQVQRNIDTKINSSSSPEVHVHVGMFLGTPSEMRKLSKEIFRNFQDYASQMNMNPSALLDGNTGARIR